MTPGNWTLGQSQTFTMNCQLPTYTRDKSQVAFVGFIQDEGDQKVAQAVRAGKEAFSNDAKAVSVAVPAFTCAMAMTPQVTVKNNGNNAITALTITPYVDGVAQPDFYWTGSLAASGSTNIALNSISPASSGGHTFSYDIAGVSGGDNNLLNNQANTLFYMVSGYSGSPVA
jgi:hypothetical protein